MKAQINKIIKYTFYSTFSIMIGCSEHNNLATIIKKSDCYWDIHNTSSAINNRISYCYKFNKDGSCLYFFTPDKDNKRDEYNFGDNIPVEKTWKVQDDTLMYILGIKRRVIGFSSDTILLVNPITNEKDTLIKNCK